MTLVTEGFSDKEIAVGLGLSTSTVKTYLSRLYRAYGLKNRAQAVGYYTRLQTGAAPKHSPEPMVLTVVAANAVRHLDDSQMSDL